MPQNLSAVPNMEEGTKNDVSMKDVLSALAELDAQRKKLLALIPAASDELKSEIEAKRYEAYVIRRKMAPLQEENERIIAEHKDLTGRAGFPLSKIKFSETEEKKFAARFDAGV